MWLFLFSQMKFKAKVSDNTLKREHPGCFPVQSRVNRIIGASGSLSGTHELAGPQREGKGEMAEIRSLPNPGLGSQRKRLSGTWNLYLRSESVHNLRPKNYTSRNTIRRNIVADVCRDICTRILNAVLFMVEKLEAN